VDKHDIAASIATAQNIRIAAPYWDDTQWLQISYEFPVSPPAA
jgi:hypothetical protein